MRTRSGRRALLAGGAGLLAAGLAAALVLVLSADSRAGPTPAQYRARVGAICRIYGPRLDRIRPPDVAEPANVIAAITAALPLIRAQERRVRALESPAELRGKVSRWLELQRQRRLLLEKALAAARKQDFRTLSVAYVDFILAGPETGRLGSAIGIPHPPC